MPRPDVVNTQHGAGAGVKNESSRVALPMHLVKAPGVFGDDGA